MFFNDEIIIPKTYCKRIEGISYYNHNYYKLPEGMRINGCDVVFEVCDEEYDSYYYVLGNHKEGKFTDDGFHPTYFCDYHFDTCNQSIVLDLSLENQISN